MGCRFGVVISMRNTARHRVQRVKINEYFVCQRRGEEKFLLTTMPLNFNRGTVKKKSTYIYSSCLISMPKECIDVLLADVLIAIYVFAHSSLKKRNMGSSTLVPGR